MKATEASNKTRAILNKIDRWFLRISPMTSEALGAPPWHRD